MCALRVFYSFNSDLLYGLGQTFPPWLPHNIQVLYAQSESHGLYCVTECLSVGLEKQGFNDVLLPQQIVQ